MEPPKLRPRRGMLYQNVGHLMRRICQLALFLLVCLQCTISLWSQPDPCTNPVCVGNALTQSVHTGRGAQYVEIVRTASQSRFTNAMTVELWMKAEAQSGNLQYIAGLWGPHNSPTDDKNDSWALYIDANDQLVFEVDGPGLNVGSQDNSIVQTPAGGLYGVWTHIAAVFDGGSQTAILYINGRSVGQATNAQYPPTELQRPRSNELFIRVGSTSGRSDNASYRTFRGQIDEYKMWDRVLTETEIRCQMHNPLLGNESGLVIYFRFNEDPAAVEACDATGNGNTGLLRSGAHAEASDRQVPRTIETGGIISGGTFADTLKCVTSKSWTFTVTDTSECGGDFRVVVAGAGRNFFTLSPPAGLRSFTPNEPVQYTLTVNTNLVGPLPNARIQVDRVNEFGNQCARTVRRQLRIVRETELEFSHSFVVYDTLLAGCRDAPFRDTVITIRNNSRNIGNSRPIRIDQLQTNMPRVFQVRPERALPAMLDPDDSFTVRVRFLSNDSSEHYFDTLRIVSDDCSPLALITLEGVVQEPLSIMDPQGRERIDRIDFEPVCPLLLSQPRGWVWNNEMTFDFPIDSIRIPEFIRMIPNIRNFPVTLRANFGNRPQFFRFRPLTSGAFSDSIVFYATVKGCVIARSIIVTGRGISSEVDITDASPVDFNNVIVGQTRTIPVNVRNLGDDQIRVSLNFEIGEQFFFASASAFNLNPGQSRSVDVLFRPLEDSCYSDRLHVFEQTCFRTDAVRLRGCGILETFEFDPIMMRTENVVNCGSQRDTIDIVNISGAQQTIRDIRLINNPGRFVPVDPPNYPIASMNIPAGEFRRFIFDYIPGGGVVDFADRVFLQYQALNETWEAPLFGTSVTPKLFVTPTSVFGTVEVGDSKVLQVIVENISSIPVEVDGVDLPNRFTIQNGVVFPRLLQPRDTIRLFVEFAPDAVGSFGGRNTIVARSESPCPGVRTRAEVRGDGVIRLLDVRRETIPFGFTTPCRCGEDVVPVFNTSVILPMTVDDVRIVAGLAPVPRPEFFSWTSKFSPDGRLPYSIPPNEVDSIMVFFCPRSPAENQFIQNTAILEIDGSGSGGWSVTHQVYLSGLRAIPYRPAPAFVGFPITPVDTSLTTRNVSVSIPDVLLNPEQEPIRVDSVTFDPDERVFTVREVNNRPFPITINPPDETLELVVDFVPRAPRVYEARMVIHTSRPCPDRDTTVLVRGQGFAEVDALSFLLDTLRTPPPNHVPEFVINNCDTVEVPIVASEAIPAKVIDITMTMFYDTSLLQYVGLRSQFENAHDTCFPFVPAMRAEPAVTTTGTVIGTNLFLKNFCGIGDFDTFLTVLFTPLTDISTTVTMRLDSIAFDTEDVLLFNIIDAGGAEADVRILRPDMAIRDAATRLDSVRILDCEQRDIVVNNTGETPITLDDLLGLPDDVRIIGSQPPLGPGNFVAPGAQAIITIEFCPQRGQQFDTTVFANSLSPCDLLDSLDLSGVGFAPDYPVRFAFNADYPNPIRFEEQLGNFDTIPVYLLQDLGTVYQGTDYWLQDISFDVDVRYNRYMLWYQGAVSAIDPAMNVSIIRNGHLRLEFRNLDTVRAGKIAEIYYKVTVPDETESTLSVYGLDFRTDSLMFINILPDTSDASYGTIGRCNVTWLQFGSSAPQLLQNAPNPASGITRVDFAMPETTPVSLKIYAVTGEEVAVLLDGSHTLKGGSYNVEFDVAGLLPGVYYYVLEAGVFKASRKMLVVD